MKGEQADKEDPPDYQIHLHGPKHDVPNSANQGELQMILPSGVK